MHSLLLLLTLSAADPTLTEWVEEGATVADARAGLGRAEPAAQLAEWKVLGACRDVQSTADLAALDELAVQFEGLATAEGTALERRRRATFVVGRLQRTRSVEPLMALAQHASPVLSAEAIKSLGRFGADTTYEQRAVQRGVIREVVFQPHPDARATAFLLARARATTGPALLPVLEALWHHDGPEVDAIGLGMLRKKAPLENVLPLLDGIRTLEVRTALREALRHGNVITRRQAADVISYWRDPSNRPVLLDAVLDADDEVSAKALRSLRWLDGLPGRPPLAIAADRVLAHALWKARLSGTRPHLEKDPSMPKVVEEALATRKTDGPRTVAALESIADRAAAKGDLRTAAIARHRAGDVYADLWDNLAATDAYWRALVLHELRGDDWFVGVAANDLGLLFRRCGYVTGASDWAFFDYVVSLRRAAGDKEGLRRGLANLGAALVVSLRLDEAKPVLVEALALATELHDPSAEWKNHLNEAYRQYLRCARLPARVLPPGAEVDVASVFPECRFVDGQVKHTEEAEAAIRQELARAVESARAAEVTPQFVCRSLPSSGAPMCAWLPGYSP